MKRERSRDRMCERNIRMAFYLKRLVHSDLGAFDGKTCSKNKVNVPFCRPQMCLNVS